MAPFRGRGLMRGRGRGGLRGGRKNGFPAARVEEPAVEAKEDNSDPSESEIAFNSSDESSSEEETRPTSSAYNTLLQSFTSNQKSRISKDESRRKRRKLHHEPSHSGGHDEGGFEEDAKSEDDEVGMPTNMVEENEQVTEEGIDELKGPFEAHFEDPDENELGRRLKAISENKWISRGVPTATGGKCVLQCPSTEETAPPKRTLRSTRDIKLKQKLAENAQQVLGDFNNVEQDITPSVFGYQDLLFGARTPQNADRLRHIFCLHALNHILKTRDRVLKNNAKLAAASDDDDAEYRDQGFTRPKVLFLLETKQACVRALDSITKLHEFEQQENKKRFLENFSLSEDKFSDDKPEDFRELFEGNDENEFRIGVKLTRKTLKLYSTFYNSDIIFASPLGLRRAIQSGKDKKKDYDFLSSIEIVVMDQADAALMQNWEHVEFVFEHLNLQPKDAHGCDFSRVRTWYLDGHAPHLRQSIVISAFLTPQINTLYNKHMRNIEGRSKYTTDYSSGMIESLPYGIKQTFSRFDSPSHLSDPDARFKYFSSTVLPQINRMPKPAEGGIGVLVFIPSYLDFVRVRNSLVDSDFSYASISEYTDTTDVRKARSHFMSGRHALLLYTGRAHHFHRYNIRGAKRVIFYGLPENPIFYDEVVGFIGKTIERGEVNRVEASVRVCFSKWERMELERVAGSKRVGKMIGDKGDVFDFV